MLVQNITNPMQKTIRNFSYFDNLLCYRGSIHHRIQGGVILAFVMMITILLCSLIYHQISHKKIVESIHSDRELRWMSTNTYLARTRAIEHIRAYFLSSESRYLLLYRESMSSFNENIVSLLTFPQGEVLRDLNLKLKVLSEELSTSTQRNIDLIHMGFPHSAFFLWEEETQTTRSDMHLIFAQINEALNSDMANRIEQESQKQSQSFNLALVLSLLASAIGIFVGFYIARSLIRPIEIIRSSACEISKGNLQIDLPFNGQDEVSRLAQSLKSMAVHIHSQLHSGREEAADNERKRIAQDIHDELSQSLFAAKLMANKLNTTLGQKHIKESAELALLSQQLNSAHSELRTLITQMAHGCESSFNFQASLAQFLDIFSRRNTIKLVCSIDIPHCLPAEVQMTFFRVLQEALNNVEKHANASKVRVCLRSCQRQETSDRKEQSNTVVELNVSDNGKGICLSKQSGLGIGGMRHRARDIGAIFNLISNEEGTQVNLRWENKNYVK